MSRPKLRLDILLVKRGLFDTRQKARAAVMSGQILVGDRKVDKPGTLVEPEVKVKLLEKMPYVGRGGLKLERAIRSFGLDLRGKVVLDVGASTGGFTDCALKHGAKLVYAVDVGYGQLAWELRNNPRVVVLERTNIRYLSKEALAITPDFAVIDVSFISLSLVLPRVGDLTANDAKGVALIKPQFEAGREKIGKKGVVKDPFVHGEVIEKVCAVIHELGWGVRGLNFSPLKGPEGNIEYLVYFDKQLPSDIELNYIPVVVEKAHACL